MFKKSEFYHDTIPKNRFSDLHAKQKTFLVVTIFALVLVYACLQLIVLFLPPKLEVVYPPQQTKVASNIIELSGYTAPSASVRINNNLVFPDRSGFFKKEVFLQNGINSFTIEAVNSFGRKTAKTVRVVYEEPAPAAQR